MKPPKSLKKRITIAMRFVSTLSTLIFASLLIFATLSTVNPLLGFASESFATNIYKHYNNALGSGRLVGSVPLNPNNLYLMTYDQILMPDGASDKQSIDDSVEAHIETVMDTSKARTLTIETSSVNEQEKKLLAYAVSKAYTEINNTFETALMGLDLFFVRFESEGELVFHYPSLDTLNRQLGLTAADLQSEQRFKLNAINRLYNSTRFTIVFQDPNEVQLAFVEVSINPIYLLALWLPFVLLLLAALLISTVVVHFITQFFAKSLIKPLEQVNQQMGNHLESGSGGSADFTLNVKRPPLEIQQLADLSKSILERYANMTSEVELQRDELEAQKEELEAQNIELEEQNFELINAKDLLQKQQDQLVRAEKMASVGQLSAAIAHEINTPLGAIQSNAQMADMLLRALPEDEALIREKAPKLLYNIKQANDITLEASRRVAEIVRSIKNFSRIDQSDFQKYDIRDGFASVFTLTSNLWKNKIHIIEDYSDTPFIDCYPSLLNQVFMNVVVNAIQAMENSGTLTILSATQGDQLIIKVRDNGTGIREGLLEMIFESGFTTKPADKGTGLGLSISREIIEKHHGKISAESELGVGTTMIIELPVSQNVT